MSTPSKEVLARAKERGFEHLDGPFFKKAGSFYYYEASTETMSIVREEDYQEYVREKEEAQKEAIKEVVKEKARKEKQVTVEKVEPEILGPSEEAMLAEIELADEKQIIDEMRGRVIEQFVYSFKIGEREVTGLSYAGVKQVAREMARRGEPIDIPEIEKEEDDTYWTVTAKAINRKTRETRFGVARQSKMMTFRDGSTKEDEFALTKAVSKAQRNALRAFLPEEIIIDWIREWRKKKAKREDF